VCLFGGVARLGQTAENLIMYLSSVAGFGECPALGLRKQAGSADGDETITGV
jgi:hypothetical protein